MNYIKDVELFNDDSTVNVIVEICPGTSNKNELAGPLFDRLVCVRKIIGQYPFYYGSFPQTYAGDKDPLDMILFTDKHHQNLDIVKVDVIGAIKTVDGGEQDDKLLCVETDCGLEDLRKQLKYALKFLKYYKGKNANMIIDKKLASMAEAEELLKKANVDYINRNDKTQRTVILKNNRNSNRVQKVRVVRG